MVSHMRAKVTIQFLSLYWRVFSEKMVASFFCENSGGVGRPYLLVASTFKGQPELMTIIPHFNGSTTWLTSPHSAVSYFSQRQKVYSAQTTPNLSSSFSFSFSSSSFPCSLSMASSSRRSTKGRGRAFSGEEGPPVTGEVVAPRDLGDNGDSSNSNSRLPESLEDVLGRPTIDPWYRSGERFPSVPVNPQPPPVDWEWLVVREDATAGVAWTPTFREI
jgi:hypothetical protein